MIMGNSIIKQCKKLYIDAFHDDEQFTDLLFDLLYESSCRYLLEDSKVVSMLFAIDITMDGYKGKYVYAVATDERYRGKGYMRKLFDSVTDEYQAKYDFLCLRPMDNSLFDFYEKLGFVRQFKKSIAYKNNDNSHKKLFLLDDIGNIKKVRKHLLCENYVEYCDEFYKLLLSYCSMLTDDILNPNVFIVKELLSGKVKEVLGNFNQLPDEFNNVPLLIRGEDLDFAMVKFLKQNSCQNKYLGFALD